MFNIKFTNIGRNKACFEKSTDNLNYGFMVGAVRPHLLSSEIDFIEMEPNPDQSVPGKVIVGGFRPVGEFLITIDKEKAALASD